MKREPIAVLMVRQELRVASNGVRVAEEYLGHDSEAAKAGRAQLGVIKRKLLALRRKLDLVSPDEEVERALSKERSLEGKAQVVLSREVGDHLLIAEAVNRKAERLDRKAERKARKEAKRREREERREQVAQRLGL